MTFDVSTIEVSSAQRDLASYIKAETGKVVKPETIAVIDALRKQYRATENERREQARKEKAAAKARDAVETLRKQAEILGLNLSDLLGVRGTIESEVAAAEPEPEEEPEPAPAPKKAPAKKPASRTTKSGNKVTAVPTPADEETLSPDIEVMESEDGFAVSQDEDGFEADEDGEDW